MLQENASLHEIWEFSEYRLLSVYIKGERKHGYIFRVTEYLSKLEVEVNPEFGIVEAYRIKKVDNCRMYLYGIGENKEEYYRLLLLRRDVPPRQRLIGRIREAAQVAWLIITGKHNR